jgi:hypothetical protein
LELPQKIATWALAQTGKKIGRGECWDFAEAALKRDGNDLQGRERRRRNQEVTLERPHHTAIVAAVLGAGAFQIYEQNVQPHGKVVQRQRLQTSNTLPVSTRSHKTVKDASGKFVQAEVISTVSVSVAGQVWAYRAKPRGP